MGRIRSIKPEFPQSEDIGRLSRDARLLFVQLWTLVDDEGRTRAASRMLASLLYPYDDDAAELMTGWLAELERNGLIQVYNIEGSHYLQIAKWRKHQKIDHPSESRLPPPADVLAKPREPSRSLAPDLGPRIKDQDRERKKERSQSSRGASLPDDWQPSDSDFAYGLKLGLGPVQMEAAAEDMRLWAKANSNRSIGRKADWSSTFKSWMRRNKQEKPNAKPTVVEAIRSHIEGGIGFGPKPQLILSAAGGSAVRLLPEGGRERPGDVHGGDNRDLVRIFDGSNPARDGPEDGAGPENEFPPNRARG